MRISHEMTAFNGKASFITLTYDPEHVPANYSISKDELQRFFKRLRKYIGKSFKIKYYACGEYGEQYGRPHYHAIILGLGASEARPYIENAWKLGQIHIDLVNPQTTQYVTGYIQKKLTGTLGKKYYEETGREAPFRLSSLGMGLNFAKQEARNFKENMSITYQGRPTPIPRYYRKKLELDPEHFKEKAIQAEKEMVEHLEQHYGQITPAELWKAYLSSREKMIEIRKLNFNDMLARNRDYANRYYKEKLKNKNNTKKSPF